MSANNLLQLLQQGKLFPRKLPVFIAGLVVGGLISFPTLTMAADRTYANVPLFWAAGVKPNVVLALDSSGSMDDPPSSGGAKKIDSMKLVANQVVADNATNMNIGVFKFTGGNNGVKLQDCGASLSALQTSINGITASSYTPLATQQLRVMEYFRGMGSYTSPIKYRCQKNFVVALTDGLPTSGLEGPGAGVPDGTLKGGLGTGETAADTGGVVNPWGNFTLNTAATSWDGFPDPKMSGDSDGYYPLMDDLLQYGFDIDMRTAASAAVAGCAESGTGTDCTGRSWDDPSYKQQNVVPYVIGFDLENELLRDAPLVDRITVTPGNINDATDRITIVNHGLNSGDYVQYHTPKGDMVIKGIGNTGTEKVISDASNVPATGTPVTYSAKGGAALTYAVTVPGSPAVPALVATFTEDYDGNSSDGESNTTDTRLYRDKFRFTHGLRTGDPVVYTCNTPAAPACQVGGLVNGSTYYAVNRASDRLRLSTSAAAAAICATLPDQPNAVDRALFTANCIDLSALPPNNSKQIFTRPGIPAGPSTTEHRTATTYYVIKISATEFKLALSATDASSNIAVDVSGAGNADQTFTYQGAATGIGGLFPYETDRQPAAGFVVPTALTTERKGKYCVKKIDVDTIELGVANPGSSPVCLTNDPKPLATATYSSVNTASTSEQFTTNTHGFDTGDSVQFTCGGSGCTVGGLTKNSYYIVAKIDATKFRIAKTAASAAACAAAVSTTDIANNCRDLSGSLSGTTHKFTRGALDGFTKIDITSPGTGIFSVGPGKSYFSRDAATLSDALNAAFLSINNQSLSASAVAANSSEFSTGSFVYQAKFNTSDWSGDVYAMAVTDSGINTVSPTWRASNTVTSSGRTILTYDGSSGKVFDFLNLNAVQKAILTNDGAATGAVTADWIKGIDQATAGYRKRGRGLVGDIINSSPGFVGANNDEGYGALPSIGTSYTQYVTDKSTLRPRGMLFVGANDGMLHGFNGYTGQELVAFIPEGVYMDWTETDDNGVYNAGTDVKSNKLFNLTQKGYGQPSNPHAYFVDGSPTVGDAYLSGQWTTVVVGGLNAGGRSIYALDARDEVFNAASVKWEFKHANLGYTFSKPIIGKLVDGTWVAVFGNGYDSGGDKAQLFVVNLNTGSLIAKIDTGAAGGNGLSSVDALIGGADGKSIVAVYAGDLLGNVWRFSGLTGSGGGSVTKLFTANRGGGPQPITSAPTVEAFNGGALVHIGTGKYMETGDKVFNLNTAVPNVHTMYTIFDNGGGSSVPIADLVEQTVTGNVTGQDSTGATRSFFTVSSNPVDYATKKGWFIDLTDNGTKLGERVVTQPVIIGPRLLFVTLIPNDADDCEGGGSSRFFELNSTSGAQIGKRILDTNGDGEINTEDDLVAGFEYDDGILSRPNAMSKTDADGNTTIEKIFGSTNASQPLEQVTNLGIDCQENSSCANMVPGRMSWRQLK